MADIRLEDGTATWPTNPERLMWYGLCGYWTDDWSAVGRLKRSGGGIPCCPDCKCIGFQCTVNQWAGVAEKFQRSGNPGYVNFIASVKGVCNNGRNLLDVFKDWLRDHPNGRETNPRSDGT